MSLSIVHEKIMILKKTTSTNTKVELLKDYLKDSDFRRVIKLMYDDTLHYKIKSLPRTKPIKNDLFHSGNKPSNQELFGFLEKLAVQKGTSNKDKIELSRLASMDSETFEVTKMIVNKDAKGGFSQKLINKAEQDFLYIIPYCRCSTEKSKMHTINFEEGVFIQEKVDGMFLNIIIDDKQNIILRSRNGNEILQLDHIIDWLKENTNLKNTVLMGELVIVDKGKVWARKAGNGIFNSCINGTANESMTKMVKIRLWDIVSYSNFQKGMENTPYETRFNNLKDLFSNKNKYFSIVPTKIIFSKKEAVNIYKEFRLKGKEGAIIKTKTAIWKNHTSPEQVKLKNVQDAELRIVGWSYGEKGTKYEKMLGSLQAETDDGKVKVSVSGFTDDQRKLDWNKEIGKIITVEYESLITDKKRKDIYSLYLPRYSDIRYDRDKTDTLEDLLKR